MSTDLPGVSVKVKTPFVSLIFTPLDDKPLAESAHILITAMAQDKQTGTRYNADGTELLAAGAPPLLMEPVQATLTFKGAPLTSVKVVDIYGVPDRDGRGPRGQHRHDRRPLCDVLLRSEEVDFSTETRRARRTAKARSSLRHDEHDVMKDPLLCCFLT